MNKLLIFFAIILLMIIAGVYIFRFLNVKIKESRTGMKLIAYSLLLFTALGLLFFTGLFILVKVYNFLVAPE